VAGVIERLEAALLQRRQAGSTDAARRAAAPAASAAERRKGAAASAAAFAAASAAAAGSTPALDDNYGGEGGKGPVLCVGTTPATCSLGLMSLLFETWAAKRGGDKGRASLAGVGPLRIYSFNDDAVSGSSAMGTTCRWFDRFLVKRPFDKAQAIRIHDNVVVFLSRSVTVLRWSRSVLVLRKSTRARG
jgi:hypothetical protein